LRARMPAFGRANTFRSASIWFADMLSVVIGSRACKLRRKRFTHKWPNVWEENCPVVGCARGQKIEVSENIPAFRKKHSRNLQETQIGISDRVFCTTLARYKRPWRMVCRESILGTRRWNQRPCRSARRVTFVLTGHALQRFATSRRILFCRLLLRNDSPSRILNYWIYVFYCNCLGPLL
jgi:hypothetical protein